MVNSSPMARLRRCAGTPRSLKPTSAEPRKAMLEVVALHAGYGDVQALFGVSFTVREGSIMAILGPNGAGKSTILRAISGLLRPSAGDIRFEGVRLNGMAPYDIAELGIAHVPEGRRVFPSLSVEENLIVGSYSKRAR